MIDALRGGNVSNPNSTNPFFANQQQILGQAPAAQAAGGLGGMDNGPLAMQGMQKVIEDGPLAFQLFKKLHG